MAVGSWREGRLQYLDEALAVVVADVRRYTDRDIEIVDPRVGKLRITGTVFADDVESWLRTLEAALPIRTVTETSSRIVIRSRPEGD